MFLFIKNKSARLFLVDGLVSNIGDNHLSLALDTKSKPRGLNLVGNSAGPPSFPKGENFLHRRDFSARRETEKNKENVNA